MAETNPNVKMIVNGAYHAATISLGVWANSFVMKKFLKWKPANLSQLDAEDIGKLTLSVFSATMLRDWLVNQGILPDQIMA